MSVHSLSLAIHLDVRVDVAGEQESEGLVGLRLLQRREPRGPTGVHVRSAGDQELGHFDVVEAHREVENGTVSVRLRSGGQLSAEPFDRFREAVRKTITGRARELVTLDS